MSPCNVARCLVVAGLLITAFSAAAQGTVAGTRAKKVQPFPDECQRAQLFRETTGPGKGGVLMCRQAPDALALHSARARSTPLGSRARITVEACVRAVVDVGGPVTVRAGTTRAADQAPPSASVPTTASMIGPSVSLRIAGSMAAGTVACGSARLVVPAGTTALWVEVDPKHQLEPCGPQNENNVCSVPAKRVDRAVKTLVR
jgi:hypothetical protein